MPFTIGEAPQNGNAAHGSQNGESNAHAMMNHAMGVVPITAGGTASGVPGPTTNLNIGMDYWGSAASSAIHGIQGKVPSAPVASGMVATGPREGVQPQLWVQVVFLSFNCRFLSSLYECIAFVSFFIAPFFSFGRGIRFRDNWISL